MVSRFWSVLRKVLYFKTAIPEIILLNTLCEKGTVYVCTTTALKTEPHVWTASKTFTE